MASSAERFRLVEGTVPATGDISNTLTNTNNTSANRYLIVNQYASNFESVGITNQNSSTFLNPLTTGLSNQTPIHKQTSATPTDLSDNNVRGGGMGLFKTPEQIRAAARTRTSGVSSLEFPVDLRAEAVVYVKLEFAKYNRFEAFSSGSMSSPTAIIYLPLPENYNQTFGLNYTPKDTGFMGDVVQSQAGETAILAARDRMTEAIRGGLSGEGVFNSLRGFVTGMADDLGGIESREYARLFNQLTMRGGYHALDTFTDVGGGLAQQITGKVPNPHQTIFFKGPNLREFTWTWRLVPRSEREAKAIRDILKALRKSILPKKDNNMLVYPDMLEPTVIGQQDLGKFKKCLVGGMTVNYSSEGASAFFRDGHPSAISLTLNFQEVEVVTAEDQDD